MKTPTQRKTLGRERRHLRVRRRVQGTPERPRLAVFRSLKQIYAQVIDDLAGRTVAAASSLQKELRGKLEGKKRLDAAKEVGRELARRALEKGVKAVVFDRGGRRYHGRVKAFADGAREGGLQF